ncbi:MAG: hypothetical protein DRO95_01185 [Candidatus Altiarchaeales archaeon]|nr:MAG: hypothetical protein DRO95_01185 [Candidatus Altiarchaeales archaeon]
MGGVDSVERRFPGYGVECILLIGLIFLIVCLIGCIGIYDEIGIKGENMTTTTIKNVRKSVIAGSWYPGNKNELIRIVDSFLRNAKKENLGKIRAIIVPHAGYMYSGQVAAFSYEQIRGEDYERVIILAPSHHHAFYGASIGNFTHYETPLGEVPVSRLADKFLKCKVISSIPEAHLQEHSIEIQLPFLQRVLGRFEIVPILIGRLSMEDMEELSNLIMKYLDDKTLIVASSDLSHYHPYDVAVRIDRQCINSIVSLDLEGAERCEMCGYFPVLITINIAKKLNWRAKLIEYKNSGDVTGDRLGVVGYAAIVFYSETNQNLTKTESNLNELNREEKKFLLKIARETLETYIREGRRIEPKVEDPRLMENRGTFVTLEKNGQLRGCIGHIEPIQPLYLDVRDNAINAAVNDPRFRPVTPDELDDIEIEISVLTKPELIEAESPEEYLEKIQEGVDGIIIEYAGRSATYLPQVWEQIPDKIEFLEHLCEKAFLPRDCWKRKGVRIYRYRVQAFKESDFK